MIISSWFFSLIDKNMDVSYSFGYCKSIEQPILCSSFDSEDIYRIIIRSKCYYRNRDMNDFGR